MSIEKGGDLQHREIGWRALAMLLFTLLYGIAEIVLVAVVLFQLISALIFRRTNARLLTFGQGLSTYIYQILRFLTFTSEDHPFPLSAWPGGTPSEIDRTNGTAA